MLGPIRRRPLRTEQLESRNLMALVAFDLQILDDVDGQPGAPVSASLEAGESFFLEISAMERGPQIDGFVGLALDIMWDPSFVRSLDSAENLLDTVTDDLPMFRSGTLQPELGRILNLSGYGDEHGGVGRRIGDGEFEHFALLHFQAITTTTGTEFSLLEGFSQTATYPPLGLRHEDHDFDVETIQIVAADAPVTLPKDETPETIVPPSGAVTAPEPDPNPEPASPSSNDDAEQDSDAGDLSTVPTDSAPHVSLSLVTDAPGELTIGDLITIDVQVKETDPDADGVGGLAIDVDWDPTELQLVLSGPLTDTITTNLPAFQGGTVDVAAGFIDELTGAAFSSTGIGRSIGDGVAETFATLTFVALKPTDASSISVSLGDGGVGLVGDTSGQSIDVADAETSVEIATAALPPLIQISTSGTASGLEFGAAGSNGVQSTLLRPGSVDALQYIEIANVGETVLEVYEIQLGAAGLSIAVSDIALVDGFSVDPGDSQRIAVVYSANTTGNLDQADGIVVVSNAGNRGRYAIATTAQTTYAADLNLDGQVNVADVVLLDSVFGQTRGDGSYQERLDPNLDGSIDLGDFGLLNAQFGSQPTLLSIDANEADDDEEFDETLDLLALDAVLAQSA